MNEVDIATDERVDVLVTQFAQLSIKRRAIYSRPIAEQLVRFERKKTGRKSEHNNNNIEKLISSQRSETNNYSADDVSDTGFRITKTGLLE